ncbi:MAG: phage tail protein [Pyrinomonadaceae bacterium]
MPEPYIGEIRMFAGNFAPAGWAFCNGALIPISENDTLFTLIGTTYGGDGQETFALPNLQSRVPMHQGTNGGQTFTIGEMAGVETVTLGVQQIPVHTHLLLCSTSLASTQTPGGNVAAQAAAAAYTSASSPILMNSQSVTPVGGSQPHENMQPYLCINFIISLFGVFPNPN